MSGVENASLAVTVDTGKCCGYGNCVLEAPQLFDLSPETNLAFLLPGAPVAEHRELLDHVARECPTDAIRVQERG